MQILPSAGPTEAVRHVAAIHPKRQIAVFILRGYKKIKPRTYPLYLNLNILFNTVLTYLD